MDLAIKHNFFTTAKHSFHRQHLLLLRLRTFAVLATTSGFAAFHLRNSYFYQDQWDGLHRAIHLRPIEAMATSINGHLMIFDYWIHRIQISAFGVDDHRFTIIIMLTTLLFINYVLVVLLRSIGVSGIAGLFIASFLTYLPTGAQDFLFVAQILPLAAVALGLFSIVIVLRYEKSLAHGTVFGLSLFFSVLADSGMATITFPAAAIFCAFCWSRKYLISLIPACILLVAWYLTADLSPHFDSTLAQKCRFAFSLFFGSVGAIVGAGEIIGIVLTGIVVFIFVFGSTQNIFSKKTKIATAAFGASTLITTVAIAISRAGMPGFTLFEANRYIHNISIPFALTVLPFTFEFCAHQWQRFPHHTFAPLRQVLPVTLVALCFITSYPTFSKYSTQFEENNVKVRGLVREAIQLIRQNCPDGKLLQLDHRPIGNLSPQVSVQLLVDLMSTQALKGDPQVVPSQAIIDAMCS